MERVNMQSAKEGVCTQNVIKGGLKFWYIMLLVHTNHQVCNRVLYSLLVLGNLLRTTTARGSTSPYKGIHLELL
jgi:hypothetical protein